MRRPLMFAACFLSAAFACTVVDAALYKPDGVAVGEEYRLVFVTAGATRAFKDASNPTDTALYYDNFVDSQVAGTMLDLDAHNATYGTSYNWNAIVSTASADRAVNTMAAFAAPGNPSDAPAVYNTNGDVVANYSSLMLSGPLDNPIRYDQFGAPTGVSFVWTGSFEDGVPVAPLSFSQDFRVGNSTGASGGASAVGFSNSTTQWLGQPHPPGGEPVKLTHKYGLNSGLIRTARVYAISDVIVAVPEPSTIAIWVIGGIGGLIVWRKAPQRLIQLVDYTKGACHLVRAFFCGARPP